MFHVKHGAVKFFERVWGCFFPKKNPHRNPQSSKQNGGNRLKQKRMLLAGFVLCALLFSACANVVMPADTSKSTSEVLQEIVNSLPKTDEFRGKTLTVLTPNEETFWGDDNAAGSVRGALKNRNQLLKDVYEMELNVVEIPEEEIEGVLQAAKDSGQPAGDLICYSAETTALLWEKGLLYDMNKLPYFDAKTSCSDWGAASALQTGNSLYLLPDPAARADENAYVMFYDRALVKQSGLENPETLVKTGKWTVAAFRRYAETIASSVMNKQSFDLEQDTFGYTATEDELLLPYLLWCTENTDLFVKRENGTVGFAFETADELSEKADAIGDLYDSASRFPLDGTYAENAFKGGRLGFYITKLSYLKELYATSERDYGVLPMPKAEEEQEEYASYVGESGRVLAVPVTLESPSRAGLGLTAVCIASDGLLPGAQKQTYVTLYSLDNDQSCMLEMILDSMVFDFGWVYGTQSNETYYMARGMFSEVLAKGSSFRAVIGSRKNKFEEYAAEHYR